MKFKNNFGLLPVLIIALIATLAIGGCASSDKIKKRVGPGKPSGAYGKLKSTKPYDIYGVMYYPLADAYGYEKVGVASWYGKKFHGKPSASGETYDMDAMTAAHKTLPLQTMVEVTRLDTGKKIVVRINDRGPFVKNRIIDLSREGARRLGMMEHGTARVKVVALAKGEKRRGTEAVRLVEPAPDFDTGNFWVQVGAFGDRINAEKVREKLLKPVSMIRLKPYTRPDGLKLLRVQVGPFKKRGQADKTLLEISNHGFPASFIVAD
ncbi:Septum-associated rare lipoprotein A [hydrothermal vent metagenome]|uniref:Septum-associated rare lipoprotein A n=1 Tax=hydrothermal vent metagenome TaxID=652676 RepID=A0A3B1CME4_9ZZZZ